MKLNPNIKNRAAAALQARHDAVVIAPAEAGDKKGCARPRTFATIAAGLVLALLVNASVPARATTLTAAQVAQAAYGAGFRGGALVNSIAVADAESSFVLEAVHNNTDGSVDRGLWQVNSVHSQYNPSLLLSSASYNASAAFDISSAATDANWRPWVTFNNGAFTTYLTIARNAAQNVDATVIRGIGDRISANISVNVRSSAGGTSILRAVAAGTTGTVLDGPVVAVIGAGTYRFIWWRIRWDDGGTGWSVEDYLSRTAGPCTITLNTPGSGATVAFPQTFTWFGPCPNTHLAFAASATPTTAQVTGQLSGSGIITATEWAAIQAALGATPTYYWNIVEVNGGSFTELSTWRPFHPVSAITSITAVPVDGAQGTVGQPFSLRVNVGHELISSGVLQVWVYDAGFATSVMDWIYVTGAQSAVASFNFNLNRGVGGAHDYVLFAQFRPGATVGPLLSSGINDLESFVYDYTINWRAPAPEIAVQVGLNTITDGQLTAIDFGTVARNAPAPSITFTVRNDGDAPLTLGAVSAPVGFTITQGLPGTLAAGSFATFVIRLDTGIAGTKAGSVSFANNDSDENPFNFPITGTVTSPEITVQMNGSSIVDGQGTAINFGSVEQNASGPSLVFTVRNDGNQTMTLGPVSVPTGFTVTQNLPNSLGVGQSTTFTIRLDTGTVGVRSGSVTFANNDPDENPFNFPITGTVTPPSAPPSVTFGRQSNKLLVTWPVSQSGFVLETTTELGTNAVWTPVAQQPSIVGTNNVVTNTVGAGVRFFRLRK